ncbi:sugar ABC transporter permease [Thermaerobacter composti]|uniref:Sugar ABC transporter permease n=1 Tax=Thermaerobacter composti TaxID=554949 RepID=A0ABZ0QL70_9FIRM|nr:sugar ABC transporter permease [Thermaerobacter composti]WPD18254.1 sugar ABC transporter permease [Thermaerobacter composti]
MAKSVLYVHPKPTRALFQRSRLAKQAAPYLFLSPFVVIFAIFLIYPIVKSLYLSFTSAEGSVSNWVGISNYRNLLMDYAFWQSLLNTAIILGVQVPVMLFLGLLLAVALNAKFIKGLPFFRLAVFLPVLIDAVTYSIVFSYMFNKQYGILNYILGLVGISGIDWLHSPLWARIAIIIALTWRWTGYNAIILLAGLQSIPDSINEAAEMDGAGRVARFFRITVPMIKPILLFCAVVSTIGTLQLFTEPYLLTHGGPANATMTPVMYIYQFAFQSFQFGHASAAAYVLTTIVAVLSYLQIRISRAGEW